MFVHSKPGSEWVVSPRGSRRTKVKVPGYLSFKLPAHLSIPMAERRANPELEPAVQAIRRKQREHNDGDVVFGGLGGDDLFNSSGDRWDMEGPGSEVVFGPWEDTEPFSSPSPP